MEISLQYLAGFVDGEGSIIIAPSGRPRADGVQTSFSATLSIANTNRPALEAIVAAFGGRIDSSGKPHNPKWKQGWAIIWKGQAALDLVEAMRPFLIIKAAQADLILEFGRLQRVAYRQARSEEDIMAMNEMRRAMSAANARGPGVGA